MEGIGLLQTLTSAEEADEAVAVFAGLPEDYEAAVGYARYAQAISKKQSSSPTVNALISGRDTVLLRWPLL